MSTSNCRTCGAPSPTLLGELPDTNQFSGRALAAPSPVGALWRCSHCGFAFRDPLLDADSYIALNERGGLNVWDGGPRRVDFELVRDYLSVLLPQDRISGIRSALQGVCRLRCEPAARVAGTPRPIERNRGRVPFDAGRLPPAAQRRGDVSHRRRELRDGLPAPFLAGLQMARTAAATGAIRPAMNDLPAAAAT